MADEKDQNTSSSSLSLIKLNKCANSAGYVKFDTLKEGAPYKVHKFGSLSTDKYKKNQTHLTAYIDLGYLILPERFNDLAATFDEIDCENLFIIYHGRDGQRLKIEFQEIE